VTDHTRRTSLRRLRGTASAGLVLALAGLMFTANARLAKDQDERHPQDLSELAKVESDRVGSLSSQVGHLRAQVDRLTTKQSAAIDTGDPGQVRDIAIVAGSGAVTGQGITVQLTDAPPDTPLRDGVGPDDLVVHQQDVQEVINALWAGGAEAMVLQDQRVTSTTAFRCVGNVLSLGGRLYSPPYEVRVIGDPKALRAALYRSPGILRYLGWVRAVGLGWSVTTSDTLKLPGAESGTELHFAKVPKGTKVFPSAAKAGAAAPTSTDLDQP